MTKNFTLVENQGQFTWRLRDPLEFYIYEYNRPIYSSYPKQKISTESYPRPLGRFRHMEIYKKIKGQWIKLKEEDR